MQAADFTRQLSFLICANRPLARCCPGARSTCLLLTSTSQLPAGLCETQRPCTSGNHVDHGSGHPTPLLLVDASSAGLLEYLGFAIGNMLPHFTTLVLGAPSARLWILMAPPRSRCQWAIGFGALELSRTDHGKLWQLGLIVGECCARNQR